MRRGIIPERQPDEKPTRRVLVYRRVLLPYSETFIRQQILSLSRWQATLVGGIAKNGVSLADLDVKGVPLDRIVTKGHGLGIAKRVMRKVMVSAGDKVGLSPRLQAQISARSLKGQPWFREVQALRPRVLHVHFGTNAGEAWPLTIALNIPMVITLHGYDIATKPEWWTSGAAGKHNRSYPETLRALARSGVTFIAVSNEIKERAIKFGLPCNSIRKILIGIDTQRFQVGEIPITERPRRVLFVGRFVEKKGTEYLIRGFARVMRALPDAELVLIGDGAMKTYLIQLTRSLGIKARFLGALTSDEVISELHRARLLCCPSVRANNGDSEGLPTVIMEAQACGVPVVTSACGGKTEGILDGTTGVAVPERDVDQLALQILRFLSDDELATRTSVAARRFAVEALDIKRHTQELERTYDDLTANSF